MLAHLKTHQGQTQRQLSRTCEYKCQIKTTAIHFPDIVCPFRSIWKKGCFFGKDLSNSNIVSSRLQNFKKYTHSVTVNATMGLVLVDKTYFKSWKFCKLQDSKNIMVCKCRGLCCLDVSCAARALNN